MQIKRIDMLSKEKIFFMKGRNFTMKLSVKRILVIMIIIACITATITYFVKSREKNRDYEEYQPQEEISEEQERQTIISLYFINKTTRKIEPEARLIDVKELVANPYKIIMNMLIDGPRNDNHEKAIPEGTTLIDANIEGDILKLNFSSEFIENHMGGKEEEQKTIECIVNTMTELTEVNSVKIIINGEENKQFKDGEVNFSQNFIRND